MIDLHTHSTESDGTDAPEVVVDLAARAGCRAVALTDHDTLSGHAPAARRAAELGVEFVPGCEVSCDHHGQSLHLLVYFVDEGEGPFQDELRQLRADRVARNHRLADRLVELGLPSVYEDAVARAAREDSVGRPHFGEALVAQGAVESVDEAFERWIGEGRPAYTPRTRVSPRRIAELATASGGVAVLAHPFSLGLAGPELESAVGELAGAGVVGLEAYYGRYSPRQRTTLVELAKRFDLVPTGGSDHHGATKPDLTVGTGRGDLKVPDGVLPRLVDRRPGG